MLYAIDVILLHKPRAACVAQQIGSTCTATDLRVPDDYLLAGIPN